MTQEITAQSPGKLILSGEHAVVYGYPAIAMSINHYLQTTIKKTKNNINFYLPKINYKKSLTIKNLQKLKDKINKRYQNFQQKKCSLTDVITHPAELSQYALIYAIQQLNLSPSTGLNINIESNILTGHGLGSSAATIISLLAALNQLYETKLNKQQLLALAVKIENLQHGKTSGLDLKLTLNGGCYYVENSTLQSRNMPTLPLQLIDTGKPQSTTGECVAHCFKYFQDTSIGEQFREVTQALDQALFNNDLISAQKQIKRNHQLLCQLNVVPKKIQDFIANIEKLGMAGKICGAGSIRGENAGTLLVVGEQDIKSLVSNYTYRTLAFQGDKNGSIILSSVSTR